MSVINGCPPTSLREMGFTPLLVCWPLGKLDPDIWL
jgi:hypothetical protein